VIAFVACSSLAAVWWLRQVHDRQQAPPAPAVEAGELAPAADGRR
jgi:hypothetical protein